MLHLEHTIFDNTKFRTIENDSTSHKSVINTALSAATKIERNRFLKTKYRKTDEAENNFKFLASKAWF